MVVLQVQELYTKKLIYIRWGASRCSVFFFLNCGNRVFLEAGQTLSYFNEPLTFCMISGTRATWRRYRKLKNIFPSTPPLSQVKGRTLHISGSARGPAEIAASHETLDKSSNWPLLEYFLYLGIGKRFNLITSVARVFWQESQNLPNLGVCSLQIFCCLGGSCSVGMKLGIEASIFLSQFPKNVLRFRKK